MSQRTKIEWATHTWNPVTGCTKVSAGCKNCYAERMVERFGGKIHGYGDDGEDAPFGHVMLHHSRLDEPLRWRNPRRVFVCSMSDLFHEAVPNSFRHAVFATMAECRAHTFMVLTKRPERMARMLADWVQSGLILRSGFGAVVPNVWLGVSVEDQATADERIPLLLETPAAVRFVSYEPALGPVDFTAIEVGNGDAFCPMSHNEDGDELCHPGIDWLICGGESGPGARPMHPDWARSARDQCQAAGVPFFFKQWGEWAPDAALDAERGDRSRSVTVGGTWMTRFGKKRAGRLLDGREWSEVPE